MAAAAFSPLNLYSYERSGRLDVVYMYSRYLIKDIKLNIEMIYMYIFFLSGLWFYFPPW